MLLGLPAAQLRRDAVHQVLDLGRQLWHGILDRISRPSHDVADGHPFDLVDLLLKSVEDSKSIRRLRGGLARGGGGLREVVATLFGNWTRASCQTGLISRQ